MKLPSILLLNIVLLLVLGVPTVFAESSDESAWPCEQAFVPEVSAAVVWDGPSVDGLARQWDRDSEITALVRRLTSRRIDASEVEALVESFAAAQPPDDRNHRLTLLFAGVLQVLNADRHKLNTGILRYSRDQQHRAEVLGDHLAEVARLESSTSDDARRQLAEMRARIEFEQRVFDDRERSIPFLCTRPRVVEQRIGELARMIAYHLE